MAYKKGDEPVKKTKAVKPKKPEVTVAEAVKPRKYTPRPLTSGQQAILATMRKGAKYSTTDILTAEGMKGVVAGWVRPNISMSNMLCVMLRKGLIVRDGRATWRKV